MDGRALALARFDIFAHSSVCDPNLSGCEDSSFTRPSADYLTDVPHYSALGSGWAFPKFKPLVLWLVWAYTLGCRLLRGEIPLYLQLSNRRQRFCAKMDWYLKLFMIQFQRKQKKKKKKQNHLVWCFWSWAVLLLSFGTMPKHWFGQTIAHFPMFLGYPWVTLSWAKWAHRGHPFCFHCFQHVHHKWRRCAAVQMRRTSSLSKGKWTPFSLKVNIWRTWFSCFPSSFTTNS